jgi:hypothetical protein
MVRVQAAGGHDLLDLDHAELAGHDHRRVEVARGAAEDQVAGLVGLPGLAQRHVGHQAALHHVAVAVEVAQFLAFGHQRAHAGAGEERRDAGAAGTQLLGQRALGRELQLELAGQVLALELLVLADVAGDHLLDLPRLSSSWPRPKPSTPALFEMTVRFLTPLSRSASISASGMPHRPKPPTAIS